MGQEIQNPTQHILQANKRANVPWLGEEESNTVADCHRKQLCGSRSGQVWGARHEVLKRVQAPERSRDKAGVGVGVSLANACKGALDK